jgi:hypothetical protein
MAMTPRLRKLVLTAHVTSSVGWLGAVAAFLALAIAGLASKDAQLATAAYLAAKVTTWSVIVPLCLASLVTGLLQALGSSWGLLRHYWVLIKLLLTLFATAVLFIHTQPIGEMARAAGQATLAGTDLTTMRIQLVVAAGAALVVLLVVTTLSVYKPRGMTRYGQRQQYRQRALSQP